MTPRPTDIPTVTEALTPDPEATAVIDGVLDNRQDDAGPDAGWFEAPAGETPIHDSVAGAGSSATVQVETYLASGHTPTPVITIAAQHDSTGPRHIGHEPRGTTALGVMWDDGTMIRVERHGKSGIWRITPVRIPDGVTCAVEQTTETSAAPSDIARITWTTAPTHVALTIADAPW